MRKVVFALILLCGFIHCASAQEYKVVSVQGGGCLVNKGNGWEPLYVNALLAQNTELKNAGTLHSEVVLREVGQRNTYRVFVRDDNFSLRRFALDDRKDQTEGNLKNFSSFIQDMIKTSKSVDVTVNYDHTITTVRESDDSGVALEDNLVRNVVEAFSGTFPLESMTTMAAGVDVDLYYDGQSLVLTNYGEEAANCYVCEYRKRYYDYSASPLKLDQYIVLPALTEVHIPYQKSEGKIILLSSKTTDCCDPYVLASFINTGIGWNNAEEVCTPTCKVPFCINIL